MAVNTTQGRAAGLLAALLTGLLLAATAWAGDDLYAVDPTPMTVVECGRCHVVHFQALKGNGGKHRFDCRECHQVFHAYNPRRDNYAAIMPQCGTCHELPHGSKLVECLSCHDNPHTPRLLQEFKLLTNYCGECHHGPAEELAKFPSDHTKQSCAACHSQQHGRIPACAECHQPHYAGQAADTCQACHPVHKQLQIGFTATTEPKNCSTCHSEAYSHWTATKSKHGQVNCTVCHTRHAMIPECSDCHQNPHNPNMLARFKSCLDCHFDPHNPPVK
jgi:hypothetical protein